MKDGGGRMNHQDSAFVGRLWVTFLFVGISLALVTATESQTVDDVYATTNRGELVRIDLDLGTAELVGDAGVFDGKDLGWTGLSFDSGGNLFVTSRMRSETGGSDECTCPGQVGCYYLAVACSRLYRIDPDTGTVLEEIGSTGTAFLSDIDFAPDGTLYGSRFINQQAQDDGGLVIIDPLAGSSTTPPNTRYGGLENGGLSVHPQTGEIWAVESAFSGSTGRIFRVDPTTGLAVDPQSLGVGLDGLEILSDGRFIATQGGGTELYEIVAGNVITVDLARDPAIAGSLNGLDSVPRVRAVEVDVKPGSDPNCFNLNGHGVIPVAILGSADFDVGEVDSGSLLLDGLGVRVRAARGPLCSFEHVNGDSFLDLVCQFEDDPASWTGGTDTAALTGQLFDGTPIEGSDSICVVP